MKKDQKKSKYYLIAAALSVTCVFSAFAYEVGFDIPSPNCHASSSTSATWSCSYLGTNYSGGYTLTTGSGSCSNQSCTNGSSCTWCEPANPVSQCVYTENTYTCTEGYTYWGTSNITNGWCSTVSAY